MSAAIETAEARNARTCLPARFARGVYSTASTSTTKKTQNSGLLQMPSNKNGETK